MHAVQRQGRVGGVQERADVQGRTGVRGDPTGVDLDQFLDCLQAVFLVDARKTEPVARAVQACDVLPGSEQLHLAVRAAVCLESFKDLGAVVQNACRRRDGNGTEGDDARVVPAVAVGVVHEEHVVGEDCAEAQLVGRRKRTMVRIRCNSDFHNHSLL